MWINAGFAASLVALILMAVIGRIAWFVEGKLSPFPCSSSLSPEEIAILVGGRNNYLWVRLLCLRELGFLVRTGQGHYVVSRTDILPPPEFRPLFQALHRQNAENLYWDGQFNPPLQENLLSLEAQGLTVRNMARRGRLFRALSVVNGLIRASAIISGCVVGLIDLFLVLQYFFPFASETRTGWYFAIGVYPFYCLVSTCYRVPNLLNKCWLTRERELKQAGVPRIRTGTGRKHAKQLKCATSHDPLYAVAIHGAKAVQLLDVAFFKDFEGFITETYDAEKRRKKRELDKL